MMFFRSKIKASIIFYPCHIELDLPLITTVIKAGSSQGNEGCYLYNAFIDSKSNIFGCHALPIDILKACKLEEKSIISQIIYPVFSEGCIFSDRGNWGIFQSSEKFTIIGGSYHFIQDIRTTISNVDEQTLELLNHYRHQKQFGGLNVQWLPKLLAHAYGTEKAEKLLKEFGLP